MGCNVSKSEETALVIRCRERKDLIRAAANHRFELAAAHVSYFSSLKEVGEALRKFVDEEIVFGNSSSSSTSLHSLDLEEGEKSGERGSVKGIRIQKRRGVLEDSGGDSHLDLESSVSTEEEDFHQHHHHNHVEGDNVMPGRGEHSPFAHRDYHGDENVMRGRGDGGGGVHSPFVHRDYHGDENVSPFVHRDYHGDENVSPFVHRDYHGDENVSPFVHRDYYGGPFSGNDTNNQYSYPSYGFGVNQPQPRQQGYWGGGGGGGGGGEYYYGMNAPPSYQGWGMPPYGAGNTNVYYMKKGSSEMRTVVQQPEPMANGYMTSYFNIPDMNGGFLGHPIEAPRGGEEGGAGKKAEVPPPPSPKTSSWDYLYPFGEVDSGFYPQNAFGYGDGSIVSSPDSDEVREREGIPKLEEETESELYREYQKSSKGSEGRKRSSREGSGSSSRSVPLPKSEASLRERPAPWDDEGHIRSSKSALSQKVDGSSMGMPSHVSSEGHIRSSKSASSRKVDGRSMGMPSHMSSEGSTKDVFMPQTSEESSKGIPLHNTNKGGSSIEIPSHSSQSSAIPGASHYHDDSSITMSSEEGDEFTESIHNQTEEKNSSNPTIVKSMDDGHVKKKGVTFDLDDTSKPDFDSSKLSSLTAISVHGTRDLREVVAEIRDDFEDASNYGKDVASMLEVGKLPYQPSSIKVILSRIMFLVAPADFHVEPLQSVKLASNTMKQAKSLFADFGEDISMKHNNLSSTLDELYAWEKKLYKEVKEEERLRIIYEKQCKRLKLLDQRGAETGKIDDAQDSVRKLLTKLSISIKAINAISNKIHRLRDDELQPQISELIHGMTRMWKCMLKCHRKQFRAIMESKIRTLRANTVLERESSARATHELQRELVSWCSRFGDWISTQKSYVESLNGWLLRCLDYELEESADGPVPFSPGRLGAPPMFVICHDWNQALEAISDSRVADAMHNFASILRQMWEKQDEEHRQRLRADDMSKDYKQRIKTLQTDKEKLKVDHHTRSDKTGVSIVSSENGISQLDDLKVDLDSLRKRLGEERAKHKDAIKMVHDAASISIQGGLVPIFKALENFTCEALKAHEQVRLQKSEETL